VPVRRPGPALVIATFTLLTLIWGTTWAAIRVSLEGFPPFLGVGIRFTIAGVVLLVCMRLFGVRHAGTPNERRIWFLNTFFSFCGSYGIVYWSEQYVPSGLTAILFATFPLFVALLAHVWLPDDRLTPVKVAGIMVGFAGVAVIFSEDFSRLGGHQVIEASLVMLGSPIVSAIASVGAKKYGRGVHPMAMTAVPMLAAGILMTLLGAVVERGRPLAFGGPALLALLYLALAGSAVTFTLYYWLMIDLPATRLALIAYTIPVVAVVVGVLFMHEPLTARMVLGGLLVVVGVATAARARRGVPKPGARAAGVS
jgi:drug/metabolite transporter (DMT)-like permease